MDSIALNVDTLDAEVLAALAASFDDADEMDAPEWDSGAVTFDPYL
jgi:hypothetical protein